MPLLSRVRRSTSSVRRTPPVRIPRLLPPPVESSSLSLRSLQPRFRLRVLPAVLQSRAGGMLASTPSSVAMLLQPLWQSRGRVPSSSGSSYFRWIRPRRRPNRGSRLCRSCRLRSLFAPSSLAVCCSLLLVLTVFFASCGYSFRLSVSFLFFSAWGEERVLLLATWCCRRR